jgi:hypothetical protein
VAAKTTMTRMEEVVHETGEETGDASLLLNEAQLLPKIFANTYP